MQDFKFFSAKSVEDCLEFLSMESGLVRIIAGGTDLIPILRSEAIHPDSVLNVLEVEELRGISEQEDVIRIGPSTTFAEMMESEVLKRNLPLLTLTASCVGSPQIRNRGTIGGNIATASPAADVLPAVMALEGELEIRSKRSGTRLLPLSETIEAPYKLRLREDEIISGILIRKLSPGTRCGFEKVGRRNALTRARMNMSVIVRRDDDGTVLDLRIVPGAVMPVARRVEEAEKLLLGSQPDDSRIEAAAEALGDRIVEITGVRWSTEYKLPVVKNIFKRVLRPLL
jgi:CO/xanthine dehydrogenase FAD-binding subunit